MEDVGRRRRAKEERRRKAWEEQEQARKKEQEEEARRRELERQRREEERKRREEEERQLAIYRLRLEIRQHSVAIRFIRDIIKANRESDSLDEGFISIGEMWMREHGEPLARLATELEALKTLN